MRCCANRQLTFFQDAVALAASALSAPLTRSSVGAISSKCLRSSNMTIEMGTFVHEVENEMFCESINTKIPYFNAPIYLENKTPIGKLDEICGPLNQVYFTIKPQDGIQAKSFKAGDKFYIGGDKLPVGGYPPEANPFLGWRAIRMCLDESELFKVQLRALMRAAQHGDVRILLPLVVSLDEVREARRLLREASAELTDRGVDVTL